MDSIGNRYMLDQTLKRMTNGMLLKGIDLTFKRDVLLYTFHETDESAYQEALRWLRKASQMSDEHFMHILDAGSEGGTLFAVLQEETGSPLSDRLRDLEIKGRMALTHVHELAKGIREARRRRLPECSLDAENLWIEHNGRLRIMDFWTEGKNGRRGVPGLALLLYQLSAKTDIPTSSIRAYSHEMNRLFADLSDVTRDRAIDLACKAYEGICTLADFQQELEVLLGIGGEVLKPNLTSTLSANDRMALSRREQKAAVGESHAFVEPKTGEKKAKDRAAPGEPHARIITASFRKMAKLSDLLRELFHPRKWHLFATAGFGVLVLLLWLSLRPHPDHVKGSKPESLPTPDSTAVSMNRTETSKPLASASAMPAQTAAPTSKPLDPEIQPADDGKEQAIAGVVPELIGHTREDAEKMAIASGLRYQFFLESNNTVKGVVFKQNLTPGTAVKKGDRITFWVSKGK